MSTSLKLHINLEPISVNSTYYNNKQHGMTNSAKSWFTAFLYQLRPYADKFKQLQELFDEKKHVYCVDIQTLIPESKLITKDSKYTSKKIDISNLEKSIIDALFLPKHNAFTNNLNIDDRYLHRLTSEYLCTTEKSGLIINIYLINRPAAVEVD